MPVPAPFTSTHSPRVRFRTPPMPVSTRHLLASALPVAFILAAGCGTPAADSVPAASTSVTLSPSDVAEARTIELTDGVSVGGSLEPVLTVQVKSQVIGTISGLTADRGTRVHAGEALMVLQSDAIRGQAASARAAVASAQAAVALADQRLQSSKRLHEAGAISDIDLKVSQAAYDAAQAQLAAAQSMYATAAENDSNTIVRSPIDGIVSARSVENGESVKDNVALLTIVDTHTLELAAQVGVEDAMKVRVGAPVLFTLDAVPGRTFEGKVARIDPRADPGTRQVGVYSRLPNPDGSIVAGQYAHGRVLVGKSQQVVAIPSSAVADSAGHPRVYVIQDGKLARRDVTLGARDTDRGLVAVSSGVQAGEKVLAVPVIGATQGLSVTMSADSGSAPRPTADPAPKSGGK